MTICADNLTALAKRYRRFARDEAQGHSPHYEKLAAFVAQSAELLSFIAELPAGRQQPNLFLAAVRLVAGVQGDGRQLAAAVREHRDAIKQVMMSRSTQTNEPGRCAVLLPILSELPQPLALLEVGASAGLCLLPDRYGYDYGDIQLRPDLPSDKAAPVFPCRVNERTPLPRALPSIAWRAGLDVNPLDVRSDSDMTWLETLVWPDQEERAVRLRAASRLARQSPPEVHQGDLFEDLDLLIQKAPVGATLVVFHSAVLGYVRDQDQRNRFANYMAGSRAIWISNESPDVFPAMAKQAPESMVPGQFLSAVNGVPVAWSGPHGQTLEWFGPQDIALLVARKKAGAGG